MQFVICVEKELIRARTDKKKRFQLSLRVQKAGGKREIWICLPHVVCYLTVEETDSIAATKADLDAIREVKQQHDEQTNPSSAKTAEPTAQSAGKIWRWTIVLIPFCLLGLRLGCVS